MELDVLSLDDTEANGSVTLEDGRVTWQGRDLSAFGVVAVETLGFSWPQPLAGAEAEQADRARRSLLLSALWTVAEQTPMIDPPAAGHLAAAPLLAQALVQEAGLAVQPWRLEPARPERDGLWLDPAGAVRGYAPETPAPGSPAWIHDPFEGAVASVLVVGGRSVGALMHDSGADWAAGRADGACPAPELDPRLSAGAEAAARALGAHAAEISLVAESGAVLLARPGPRWSSFEAALGPAVPRALLEHAVTLLPAS